MDFFTPSLDRFPDMTTPPKVRVGYCTACHEDVFKGDTVYTGTDENGKDFCICIDCYDNMQKDEIFDLMGGKKTTVE